MIIHDVDTAISLAINRAAGHSAVFDRFVIFLTASDLMKGGVVMAVIWGVWLVHTGDVRRNRGMLLAAVLGSLLALFFARALAYAGPIRLRPLLDPQLHFRAPTGLPPQTNWTSWSSFPSDHAALFFALAWGVWLASRRAGTGLMLYVLIVICLPRLYTGIHYFSDLFAGAVIGITCSAILSERPLRERLANPLLNWADRHPSLFYFGFALLTFQLATLFWDVRTALSLCGFST